MKQFFRSSIVAALALCVVVITLRAQAPTGDQPDQPMVTIDHFVGHISTVPANSGEHVKLFVREKARGGPRHGKRPVVLMIHGSTISAVPVFDLQFENYSWMEFLANAGFDVFAMDVTGYGLSPRPMMNDPCNSSAADQQAYLIPAPLALPCAPSYPFRLTSTQSDWEEIDTVVDYIVRRRHVDRVNLIGWSGGGPRAGGYAARHPEKVHRLFLYAPGYNRLAPSDPPAVLPDSGVPMTVLGRANFHDLWDTQLSCANQFTPAIRDVITFTMLKFDTVGSTWGTAGVRRAPVWSAPGPGFALWGWNAKFSGQVVVPTLLIRGDADTQVPAANVMSLYADLGSARKVFIHVACASHYLVWENQHRILLSASEEWLRDGTFAGYTAGAFFVDTQQRIHKE